MKIKELLTLCDNNLKYLEANDLPAEDNHLIEKIKLNQDKYQMAFDNHSAMNAVFLFTHDFSIAGFKNPYIKELIFNFLLDKLILDKDTNSEYFIGFLKNRDDAIISKRVGINLLSHKNNNRKITNMVLKQNIININDILYCPYIPKSAIFKWYKNHDHTKPDHSQYEAVLRNTECPNSVLNFIYNNIKFFRLEPSRLYERQFLLHIAAIAMNPHADTALLEKIHNETLLNHGSELLGIMTNKNVPTHIIDFYYKMFHHSPISDHLIMYMAYNQNLPEDYLEKVIDYKFIQMAMYEHLPWNHLLANLNLTLEMLWKIETKRIDLAPIVRAHPKYVSPISSLLKDLKSPS